MALHRKGFQQRQQTIHCRHSTQHGVAEEEQQSAVGEPDGITGALVDESDASTRAEPQRHPLAHALASCA